MVTPDPRAGRVAPHFRFFAPTRHVPGARLIVAAGHRGGGRACPGKIRSLYGCVGARGGLLSTRFDAMVGRHLQRRRDRTKPVHAVSETANFPTNQTFHP